MSWNSSVVTIVTVDSRTKDYVEKGYVLFLRDWSHMPQTPTIPCMEGSSGGKRWR
jgi:hypothetical protein